MNVFYYLTYDDKVDLNNIDDQPMKIALESQIVNFGQIPAQLFLKQHPEKMKREKRVIVDENSIIKVYRPCSNNIKKKKKEVVQLKNIL